jgi:hypothetical protein
MPTKKKRTSILILIHGDFLKDTLYFPIFNLFNPKLDLQEIGLIKLTALLNETLKDDHHK